MDLSSSGNDSLPFFQELADAVREELAGTSIYLVGMMGRLVSDASVINIYFCVFASLEI